MLTRTQARLLQQTLMNLETGMSGGVNIGSQELTAFASQTSDGAAVLVTGPVTVFAVTAVNSDATARDVQLSDGAANLKLDMGNLAQNEETTLSFDPGLTFTTDVRRAGDAGPIDIMVLYV